ncbi:MAG: sulfotransferase [Magnetococcales bacterium]|nr:sulfotransferase [Magnetococcales bacterium]
MANTGFAQREVNIKDAFKVAAQQHIKGELDLAETNYNAILKTQPDYALAIHNLGLIAYQRGDVETAMDKYRESLKLLPTHADAYNNLGVAYQSLGQLDEAMGCYQKAVKLKPTYAQAIRHLALYCKQYPFEDGEIDRIKKLITNREVPELDAMHLHFALGHTLDFRGDYDDAFKHFKQGNDIHGRTMKFDFNRSRYYVEHIKKTFTKEYFEKRAHWGLKSDLPVFIIGMPRSGTSLVEQILASHDDAYGAGELRDIRQMVASLRDKLGGKNQYPQNLRDADMTALMSMGSQYLERVVQLPEEKVLRISDKMPFNFMHLGLIAVMFPNCKIIRCGRHPLDTCLSNYFQFFPEGNQFSYDLHNIGFYHRQYEELTEHWAEVLPVEILDVNYEDVVANPKQEVKRMLKHVDLPWSDDCLAFHKKKRSVRTASAVQVRQPLYNRSVARWEKYRKYVDPIIDGLGWDKKDLKKYGLEE